MAASILLIPNWHPAKLNQLLNCHWGTRNRRKRSDRDIVGGYALVQNIPRATNKRRVSLTLTLAPGQRAGDVDCYWKSLLDALVHARLLVDDNRQNCELGEVVFVRGKARATLIALEDIGEQ